jgi:hypothetical protein
MDNPENVLSALENELEKALQRESSSAIAIGDILQEIKEQKLYKLEFNSLVSYAQARFNLGKASVYNYITTSRVSRTIVISPRQLRLVSVSALSKLATYPAAENIYGIIL